MGLKIVVLRAVIGRRKNGFRGKVSLDRAQLFIQELDIEKWAPPTFLVSGDKRDSEEWR